MPDGYYPGTNIPIKKEPAKKEPVKKDAKAKTKRKVLERVVETIYELCDKVDCGRASYDEMNTLVDLVKIVAY